MNPLFPRLPHQLGGYTLTRFLSANEESELYEATQARVNRAVVMEILCPGTERDRESAFLNRARMCAATEALPHVAHVAESLRADGLWFLAQERPSGYSLADLQLLGHMLTAPQVCHIIEAAAEMYSLCEESGLHAGALRTSDIYLNAGNRVQFLSPLAHEEASATAIRRALADTIFPMRPAGVDGENRILSLLQWLTDGHEDGSPVDWSTFRETCLSIRQQMEGTAPTQTAPPAELHEARNRRKRTRARRTRTKIIGMATASVLIIAGLGSTGFLYPMGEQEVLPAAHEGFLTCKRHGITQRVMLNPVSIAAYEQFLLALEEMSEEQRCAINRDIPDSCTDHIPDEWEHICTTAKQTENGLNTPMTHVCYWDALAYARYMGNDAGLPDAAQLRAVREHGGASSLLEWSATATGPNPLQLYPEDAPLLIDMAADARPCPADNAAMRLPRTGFRLVFPTP
ncbi:MAG: SUMF1/EgtB/PvdO family nonheme iron enzyme [Akkermansia sp.]|nr:SUMF1/EgtB/PvdO family nonheme iron enzyme [Akkermansia sp.]